MSEVAIQMRDVCKEYQLGQIGGTTLQNELQSWWARRRGLEDPNSKIGATPSGTGRFLALDHVNLTVNEGEALGIIGRNGAGKSTLLKLLSSVTAPTSGDIDIYGRVASMLEVGTGFHREMTGRENVYMNGAILGMSRAEIDAKMDQIIEFSEVGEFIDTPVKRYSSGMYVKLAFSVAAHLESEIIIMDEVLAVGDMLFQRKCLDKMRAEATGSGRTVLYVSHNMSTIRQLCDRCIVLDAGRVVFDGAVEDAIALYLKSQGDERLSVNLAAIPRTSVKWQDTALLLSAEYPGRSSIRVSANEPLVTRLAWQNRCAETSICLRVELWTLDNVPQASFVLDDLAMEPHQERVAYDVSLDLSQVMPGEYKAKYTLFFRDAFGNSTNADSVTGLHFERVAGSGELVWDASHWGHVRLIGASAQRVS